MSKCVIDGCHNLENFPLFPLPKNEDVLRRWKAIIYSASKMDYLKTGDKICQRHFEKKCFHHADNELQLKSSAMPTLHLRDESEMNVDYEELLSRKSKLKKKRGTSGLINLQKARIKKAERKERLKKAVELRRLAMAESKSNSSSSNSSKTNSRTPSEYDESEKDYFLSERKESEIERVLISLRLASKLHDGKTTLKQPSPIRKASNFPKNFPLFNSIRKQQTLIENNPVMWDTEATISFIENYISNKIILMKFQQEEINGEAILNLTDKNDLIRLLQLDEQSAEILSSKFEQLKRETILRYVNS